MLFLFDPEVLYLCRQAADPRGMQHASLVKLISLVFKLTDRPLEVLNGILLIIDSPGHVVSQHHLSLRQLLLISLYLPLKPIDRMVCATDAQRSCMLLPRQLSMATHLLLYAL